MKESKEKHEPVSRRSMLKGSAMFIAVGIAGGITTACSTKAQAAPPLPWKWVELDPMEAGRRAYRGYHEYGG